ncbi:zinc ribbon domain-containing protein [Amnibacterium kyonggiense]
MTVPGISAPPAVQARLLDLQRIDDELTRVAQHRRRLEQASDVAAAEAERTSLRRTAADRRGELEDLRTRIGRVETDVRTVEQRLERDRSRLATTSSPKDAHGLEQEIASLRRRREALEDDELGLMEQVESVEAAAGGVAADLDEVDQRLAALRTDRDDALAGLDAQHADAAARRAGLVGELPADLVALYDRQRTRYGVGAARLVGAVSEGSNMALTGADLAEVRAAAADAIVLDPESGCILVRS